MNKNPSLLFCIVMDLVGYSSYSVPFLGEISDVVWAPLSAIIFYFSFGGRKALFGSAFNFVEELLPGTDFIPTFTIAWVWRHFSEKKSQPTVINYDRETV